MLETVRSESRPGAPLIRAGEVRVWHGDLNYAVRDGTNFYRLLSEDERLRAAQFNEARQRARFIAGRGILREILGRCLNMAGRELRFCYGPRGKPLLLNDDGGSPCYFNLAHSGERLVLAVTRIGEIGVDIEQPRAGLEVDTIARYICTPRERAALRSLSAAQRQDSLLRCW
ncbi:MAG: 4'-phosphopantetheinyl transferase superfamily protein, partial [Pseudomonadota bacterium]